MLQVLPDPNHGRNIAGEASSSASDKGPGFKSVKFSSKQKVMRSRTNSGRIIQRSHAYHNWDIGITYNPLTLEEFEGIYAFLLEKRMKLEPFYVQLPQYRGQSSSTTTVNAPGTDTTIPAGSTTVNLTSGHATNCSVGDLFTFDDDNNSNHKKAYKIIAIKFNIIHISPPLSKAVSDGADVVLQNPLIKVIQKGDVQEYSLNTNNLYRFSLNLEEVQ